MTLGTRALWSVALGVVVTVAAVTFSTGFSQKNSGECTPTMVSP